MNEDTQIYAYDNDFRVFSGKAIGMADNFMDAMLRCLAHHEELVSTGTGGER